MLPVDTPRLPGPKGPRALSLEDGVNTPRDEVVVELTRLVESSSTLWHKYISKDGEALFHMKNIRFA